MASQQGASSLAMRRIMKEYRDIKAKKQIFVYAQPLENEPFQWHFTIRGPTKTDFEGGVYHGLVSLPYEYPMKPPYIMFFTVSCLRIIHNLSLNQVLSIAKWKIRAE